MRLAFFAIPVLLASRLSMAGDVFERLADPEDAPYRIVGTGVLTDDGHPERAFQFRRHEFELRLSVHPQLGEYAIEIAFGTAADETDRYYVRRGRIFQVDKDGKETDAKHEGDLRAATVAALHPAIVANAIRERREMARTEGRRRLLFAWNDELWTVGIDRGTGRIRRLDRRYYEERHGDGTESVVFEYRPESQGLQAVQRTVVTSRGREIARIDFSGIERGITMSVPAGNTERDRALVVAAEEIELVEVAPHLFAIDLRSMNTRILVAEFKDHLVVLEGAYNARICDLVAEKLRRQLRKPVRYFAFSHLHGQYIGGTRSWVREGATVLVPPATAPLVEAMVGARHDLFPDLLARAPRPLQLELVENRRRFEDETNALEIFNIESEHTDDYLIFYFPRQKILMSGDLLWYRPGKTMTGRSRKLCDALEKLQLDVERFYVTWPLDDRYGTPKNVVSGDEMRTACKASP